MRVPAPLCPRSQPPGCLTAPRGTHSSPHRCSVPQRVTKASSDLTASGSCPHGLSGGKWCATELLTLPQKPGSTRKLGRVAIWSSKWGGPRGQDARPRPPELPPPVPAAGHPRCSLDPICFLRKSGLEMPLDVTSPSLPWVHFLEDKTTGRHHSLEGQGRPYSRELHGSAEQLTRTRVLTLTFHSEPRQERPRQTSRKRF